MLYECRTLLHNTKITPIEITIVQLLPRSNNEKIMVFFNLVHRCVTPVDINFLSRSSFSRHLSRLYLPRKMLTPRTQVEKGSSSKVKWSWTSWPITWSFPEHCSPSKNLRSHSVILCSGPMNPKLSFLKPPSIPKFDRPISEIPGPASYIMPWQISQLAISIGGASRQGRRRRWWWWWLGCGYLFPLLNVWMSKMRATIIIIIM
jgi:hypothetical protein